MRLHQATSKHPGNPEEIEKLSAEISRLERAASRISHLRLLCFLGAIAAFVPISHSVLFPVIGGTLALTLFAALVFAHSHILDRVDIFKAKRLLLTEKEARRGSRRQTRAAPVIVENAVPLEKGLRVHRPEPPSSTLDPATADDLGLFGSVSQRSVFGLLDTSSTLFGSRRLQRILLHPLEVASDIRTRQASVLELTTEAALRERLLAAALPLREHDLSPIARMLSEPPVFTGRTGLLLVINALGSLAPILLLASAVTRSLGPLQLIVPLIFLNMAVIGANVKRSNPVRDRLLLLGPLLDTFLRLEAVVTAHPPRSDELSAAAQCVTKLKPHAARLGRFVRLLELHSFGLLFELWNLLTLWELRILPLAEKVVAERRPLLENGVGALGEIEALVSLSLPLAEQEGFEIPSVLDGTRAVLEAAEIGHPNLEAREAVRNPLALGNESTVLIVTGSNMAGKSTYLKSIGVNLALANAGGPVCAKDFRWTPLWLYSDINVRDSLDDGKSYFQVEVERVLKVIQKARESARILGIFDELFRGTNSEERIALVRAILRHLRDTGALVVVATHDLALTRLVTDDGERGMRNLHFRETVEGTEMRFDYRLREGPAVSRNAIRVLEAVGYPESITREARRECSPPARPLLDRIEAPK